HRPPVGDAAVVLHGRDVADALGGGVAFGDADRGDLGGAEHGVRYEAVVGRHGGVLDAEVVQQVVLDDACFVVGDVLEFVRRADVAERVDPVDVRALVVVDLDVAGAGHGDPRGLDAEHVGVGPPAGGDQQQVAFDGFGAAG